MNQQWVKLRVYSKADLELIEDLKHHYECEYCDECGGDWYDHDIVIMNLGDYGNNLPFYRCKSADNPNYRVRLRESCPYKKFHLDYAKYSDYCAYCGHSPIIVSDEMKSLVGLSL